MPRRKPLPPIPQGDPNGTYMFNPETGEQTFVPFEELKEACEAMMDPRNAHEVEAYFGKMNYRFDPTYHMRRKR